MVSSVSPWSLSGCQLTFLGLVRCQAGETDLGPLRVDDVQPGPESMKRNQRDSDLGERGVPSALPWQQWLRCDLVRATHPLVEAQQLDGDELTPPWP